MSTYNYGTILQYKGPFSAGATIGFQHSTKIGISINEKDYMRINQDGRTQGFIFTINGQTIRLGETFMYETDNAIEANSIIQFPNGAPESTLVNIVYQEEE